MFLLSRQCQLSIRSVAATTPLNIAAFKTSAASWDNSHYEALGIPRASTQSDIKAAYYKLSKQYHPDKNQGSTSASKKFREISQAYEVLGNYRLRRLYDKGIIHTAGSQYAQQSDFAENIEPEVEDDPETKFYKSRFKKSKVADAEGRTPIYDFDEWSRSHYGKSFERRKTAKAKFDRQENHKQMAIKTMQSEVVIFLMMAMLGAMYVIFYVESSYDTPKKFRSTSGDDKKKS